MKKALIAILIIVAAVVVLIATRPATFHIERSVEIGAPAEIPFAMVNGLKQWEAWSPWDKLDPNLQRTYEGPESGVGAKYHWVGNDDVGEGRMSITESVPNQKVVFDLEFLKPMEAKHTTTFTFAPEADNTKVVWAMDGNHNFMGKAFGLFMDMDAMVGADFAKGLSQMKTAAEAEAAKRKEAEVAAPAEPAEPADPAQPEQ